MPDVESSMMRAADYDAGARTLLIVFRNGSRYRYADVPPSTYRALLEATSKGRYFDAHVRGRFAFTKLA